MKKVIMTVALILATTLVGCKKDNPQPDPVQPTEKVEVTFIRTDTGLNNYLLTEYVDGQDYNMVTGSYDVPNNDTIQLMLDKGKTYHYMPQPDYITVVDPEDSTIINNYPIPIDFKVYVGSTLVSSGFGCTWCEGFFLAEE